MKIDINEKYVVLTKKDFRRNAVKSIQKMITEHKPNDHGEMKAVLKFAGVLCEYLEKQIFENREEGKDD